MRNSDRMHNHRGLIVIFVALFAFAMLPLLTTARSLTGTINIVNNSSREIRHVYLSHVNSDDWGDNQLGETTIAAGQSATISNFTCDQGQIKVIAEDQDGCFLSLIVTCSDNTTWTITDDTARDCGN